MTRLSTNVMLASVAMAALTGAAHAEAYVFGHLGYSTDGAFEPDNSVFATDALDQEENFLFLAGGGYEFSYGLRLEGELGWRDNDLEGSDLTAATGSAGAWTFMVNGLYDFNRGGTVQPYVGLGIGMAAIDVDGSSADFFFDDDSTVFAWQGLVGLGWAVTEQVTLDFGYRYLDASEVEFEAVVLQVPVEASGDYDQQAVTFGVRYSFAPPMPPPPPPPPPAAPRPPPAPSAACPTSEFVVYFEWDRSNLNQEAQETISAALNRARQCRVSAATVVGHTDTSGSTEYNAGLSERRAGVVRDALVAGGMPANMIMTDARGESDLARATADGVREPLNRRAAVSITFR